MTEATRVEINVRGRAEERLAAERATISLDAHFQGRGKATVLRSAIELVEPLRTELEAMSGDSVTEWSSGQIHTYADRPWSEDGKRKPLVHHASIEVRAEFVDFERMSEFLDGWAGRKGVQVGHISWDVTREHRAEVDTQVRRAAVADALAKATAFAEAVGRTRVEAVQLSDPGLSHDQAGHDIAVGAPMLMSKSGPSLDLKPADITISATVEARFTAS